MSTETLGSYLRAHREARKLTQDEAGALVSVSGRFWSDVETGEKILNQDRIDQLHLAWPDMDIDRVHGLGEAALFAPDAAPADAPMGWEKHQDRSGAWFRTVTRPDGAVIYCDVWSTLDAIASEYPLYHWAAGADGREWSRSRIPTSSLRGVMDRGTRAMDRLQKLYVARGAAPGRKR